ncbi:hypothetical protein D3C87_1612910 [compost metagenome]|jgi:hypothetical protein|uniref:hypothetical protein n=1 Tax=unclassified Pedobacter TaxID=2628915 RepID=UPI000FBE3E8C
MQRLCIYPKEAAGLLEISVRQAQRIFKAIREELNKKKRHLITIKEFSEHKGLEESEVLKALNKNN